MSDKKGIRILACNTKSILYVMYLFDDGLSVLSARISVTNNLYYIRGCMGRLEAFMGWFGQVGVWA